jgi:membrane fusion protein, multidrug efflux system
MSDKTRTLLLFGIIGGLLIGMAVFRLMNKNKKAQTQRANQRSLVVEAAVARKWDFSEILLTSGSVLPVDEAVLRSELAARITGVHFDDGAIVTKDQVLVTLFSEDIDAQIKRVNASIALAEKTLRRREEAFSQAAVSEQEVDEARERLETLQAELMLLEIDKVRSVIRSPYTGITGMRNISVGSRVSVGDELLRVRNQATVRVHFSIPERYRFLTERGAVIYLFSPLRGEWVEARPINSQWESDPDTRTLQGRVSVTNKDFEWIVGSFVQVKLELASAGNTLALPSHALIPDIRGHRVWRMENGLPQSIFVEPGNRNDSLVEIRSGLNLGDTILTTGLLQVRAGQAVEMAKIVDLR